MSKEEKPRNVLHEQMIRRRAAYPSTHFLGRYISDSIFFPPEFDLNIGKRLAPKPFQAESALPDRIDEEGRVRHCFLGKAFTPAHLEEIGQALTSCLRKKPYSFSKQLNYWSEMRKGTSEVFAIIEGRTAYRKMTDRPSGRKRSFPTKRTVYEIIAAFDYNPIGQKIGPVLGWKNMPKAAMSMYAEQISAATRFIQIGEAYDMTAQVWEFPEYRRGRKR